MPFVVSLGDTSFYKSICKHSLLLSPRPCTPHPTAAVVASATVSSPTAEDNIIRPPFPFRQSRHEEISCLWSIDGSNMEVHLLIVKEPSAMIFSHEQEQILGTTNVLDITGSVSTL
jgi:hypothetical protein